MNAKTATWLGSVSAICLALLGLAWALSPRIYASSIETAVRSGDLSTLARRIDANGIASSSTSAMELVPPGLKVARGQVVSEALRRRFNSAMAEAVGSDPAFVQKFANLLAGRGLVSQQLLDQMPPELLARRTPEFSGESGPTVDTYLVRVGFRETGEQVTLVLERKGWFTWRAARLAVSGGSATWPFRAP